MIKTNLKIALRNLYREKIYAAINVAGLSLAITCCVILAVYLKGELTYDQHFENHENIYRVVNEFTINGETRPFAHTSNALGQLITEDFDEVEAYVVFDKADTPRFISNGTVSSFWPDTYFVSTNVFDMFSHDIIYGDPDQALLAPNGIAVSQSFAEFYFGNENPIGQTLEHEMNGDPLVVNLVFADLPPNTHMKYDLLLSRNRQNFPEDLTALRQSLFYTGIYTYLQMAEGFNPDDFAAMSDSFYERHMSPLGNQIGMTTRFSLEPLDEIHFYSTMPSDLPQGNPAYLYAFSAVALFILIVACINYTNLATARSLRRSKEVGLRKILGANKGALMFQFLAEALLYAFVSALIAVVMVEILLGTSWVTQLLGKPLAFSLLSEPQLALWLVLLTVGIGISAGFYPALYLSSWAPLSALVSSSKSAAKSNIKMRQGLVLIQFTISIAVIAATLLMSNQMRFISDRALGFDKQNLVVVHMIGGDLIRKSELIKAELTQHPDILGATVSVQLPGQIPPINAYFVENAAGQDVQLPVQHTDVDKDYLEIMGMELISGRDFSQRLLTDVGIATIVNESMVRSMGWSAPLGKRIAGGRVIGVVKDFNFLSLHTQIAPLALQPLHEDYAEMNLSATAQRYMTIRIAGTDTRNTLAYLRDRFSEFDPVHTVDFEFIDDHLNTLYESEESLMRLIGLFAGVCIFIAALGLFGLSSFTTDQRSKEIAIRKVLGASTGQIILMLSKAVLGLVLAGSILASLIAYWAINEWLASFAYRADLNISSFVVATLAALAVAYVTTALQAWKTAGSDPSVSLRTE